ASPNGAAPRAAPTAAPVASNSDIAAPAPAPNKVAPTGIPTPTLVAVIWVVGALLVLLRLAIGTWRVNQLAREGLRVEDGTWLSLTQRLANRLGVTRPLTLLRGERLAVPVTWGVVYPAVLLPQDADAWTEERRRFVLVHEMAHIKRFDALTQLVAQIAVGVFWFDPLVWLAAHRMRVEREHACDDYVLRDGTTPSLYAGELLEMVRSIGTPSHDRAAPAFAALAMARRSEFEGRMLAILDPRLDRHTLHRRGTFMTAAALAILVFPLAALRPYQKPAAPGDDLPQSFKISFSDAGTQRSVMGLATAQSAKSAQPATSGTQAAIALAWSCDTYRGTSTGSSTHINVNDSGANQIIQYMTYSDGRCSEATVVGPAKFSSDETHIAELSPGGFARFRERAPDADRALSVVPAGDGSLGYTATVNGKTVAFDATMQTWLARFLPQVLREAGINVPERVARLRASGGVTAVLREISQIHSSSSKRAHYEALLKSGHLSDADGERIAAQVAGDLVGSSGDLSSIIQQLPRGSLHSNGSRQAIATAISHIASSGDKASTLEQLAPTADPEMLLILAKAAETLPSSGDKANFLIATAAEYLTPRNDALRNAFFRTASTIPSSGDMANVLLASIPYGHADAEIPLAVVEVSKSVASSGDAANVLIDLVSQRVLQPSTARATLAAIQRTLTMGSSGDRANVLIEIANANILTTTELRQAYVQAAMALPSAGDRDNALTAVAKR
ncbi:MAG TPA: M56 family metallopeptidase, partial [Gemmatimonadaceae bacterium]